MVLGDAMVKTRVLRETLEIVYDYHIISAEVTRHELEEGKAVLYTLRIIVDHAGGDEIVITIHSPETFIRNLIRVYEKMKESMNKDREKGYKVVVG